MWAKPNAWSKREADPAGAAAGLEWRRPPRFLPRISAPAGEKGDQHLHLKIQEYGLLLKKHCAARN